MARDEANRPAVSHDDALAVQQLLYGRLTAERDRVRGARAFFARQLGPLPTFAGISVALVGAFSDTIKDDFWLGIAFVLLVLMIVTSVAYSGMPPYRRLRAHRVSKDQQRGDVALEEGEEGMTPSEWYAAEITLERDIYGSGADRSIWKWPRWNPAADLQEQHDRERFGVFVVQFLFLLVIGALLLAR